MTREEKLQKLLTGFENKWVALSPDYSKVVASGDTLDEITNVLGDNRDPVFFKVFPGELLYSPITL